MTVFDYIFLSVLVLSAFLGMWRGLVSEILALFAWIAALLASWLYAGTAAGMLIGVISEPGWRYVAGFLLIFMGVLAAAAILRFLLRALLKASGLRATDRFFGTVFGLMRGLTIALVLVLLGGIAGMAREPWWSDAMFSQPLETAVIAAKPWLPEVVAERVRFR